MTVLFAALSSCKKDTPTFTVIFDSKGGTPTPATQTVEKGGMVEKPADPTLTDHQSQAGQRRITQQVRFGTSRRELLQPT